MRGFFSTSHCQNPVELQEIKQVWGFPEDWVPMGFWTLRPVYPESPANHQLEFRFSYPLLAPLEGFCSGRLWFSVSACLSNLGDISGLYDLKSLRDLREVIDFQFIQLFTSSEVMISQLFTRQTRNSNSSFPKISIALRNWSIFQLLLP